jgi:hypothetical protein
MRLWGCGDCGHVFLDEQYLSEHYGDVHGGNISSDRIGHIYIPGPECCFLGPGRTLHVSGTSYDNRNVHLAEHAKIKVEQLRSLLREWGDIAGTPPEVCRGAEQFRADMRDLRTRTKQALSEYA